MGNYLKISNKAPGAYVLSDTPERGGEGGFIEINDGYIASGLRIERKISGSFLSN